ncbi:UNVERIFIED_CONTAM: hypothetical protein EX528_17260 [Xanthomonas axonopodis]
MAPASAPSCTTTGSAWRSSSASPWRWRGVRFGNRDSGFGIRDSGIGNRESGIGNRESVDYRPDVGMTGEGSKHARIFDGSTPRLVLRRPPTEAASPSTALSCQAASPSPAGRKDTACAPLARVSWSARAASVGRGAERGLG